MDTKAAILQALRDGQHLTPLNMLIRFKTLAGGQRCNELAKVHPEIQKYWTQVIAENGTVKRIRSYYWKNPAPGVPKPQGPDGHSSTASPPALDRAL